jgi:hypothetical protein
LVSPQSFPHLWKKLWKIGGLGESRAIQDRNTASLVFSGPGTPEKSRLPGRRKVSELSLWDDILARIETKVNRHSFYTWFRPTTFVAEDRLSLTVRVPNPLFKDWLTKHYSGVIAEAMSEVKRPNLTLNFVADAQMDVPVIPLGPEEAALESGQPPATPPGSAGLNPRSTPSSSDPRTSLRMRRVARWRKRLRDRTTRCSSTAVWVWERRT